MTNTNTLKNINVMDKLAMLQADKEQKERLARRLSESIQENLQYNNCFADRLLTTEQLGNQPYDRWTALCKKLHQACYTLYAQCENEDIVDLAFEAQSLNLQPAYDALKPLLTIVGEVAGHAIKPSDTLIINLISYSGKRANKDSEVLKNALSDVKYFKSKYMSCFDEFGNKQIGTVSDEDIATYKKQYEDALEVKDQLLSEPNNRIKQPTRVSEKVFRLDFEHKLARIIMQQHALGWEELEEIELTRKEKRRAAKKARKAQN